MNANFNNKKALFHKAAEEHKKLVMLMTNPILNKVVPIWPKNPVSFLEKVCILDTQIKQT